MKLTKMGAAEKEKKGERQQGTQNARRCKLAPRHGFCTEIAPRYYQEEEKGGLLGNASLEMRFMEE